MFATSVFMCSFNYNNCDVIWGWEIQLNFKIESRSFNQQISALPKNLNKFAH